MNESGASFDAWIGQGKTLAATADWVGSDPKRQVQLAQAVGRWWMRCFRAAGKTSLEALRQRLESLGSRHSELEGWDVGQLPTQGEEKVKEAKRLFRFGLTYRRTAKGKGESHKRTEQNPADMEVSFQSNHDQLRAEITISGHNKKACDDIGRFAEDYLRRIRDDLPGWMFEGAGVTYRCWKSCGSRAEVVVAPDSQAPGEIVLRETGGRALDEIVAQAWLQAAETYVKAARECAGLLQGASANVLVGEDLLGLFAEWWEGKGFPSLNKSQLLGAFGTDCAGRLEPLMKGSEVKDGDWKTILWKEICARGQEWHAVPQDGLARLADVLAIGTGEPALKASPRAFKEERVWPVTRPLLDEIVRRTGLSSRPWRAGKGGEGEATDALHFLDRRRLPLALPRLCLDAGESRSVRPKDCHLCVLVGWGVGKPAVTPGLPKYDLPHSFVLFLDVRWDSQNVRKREVLAMQGVAAPLLKALNTGSDNRPFAGPYGNPGNNHAALALVAYGAEELRGFPGGLEAFLGKAAERLFRLHDVTLRHWGDAT